MIRTKRIHESASSDDGKRIYIDRLWPRGMEKDVSHNNATAPKEILTR